MTKIPNPKSSIRDKLFNISLVLFPSLLFALVVSIANASTKSYSVQEHSRNHLKTPLYYNIDQSSYRKQWCARVFQCSVLAEAGYYEARNQNDIGVVAVMHVIMNRVNDKTYFKNQNSVHSVVYQGSQFSYTFDGSKTRKMTDKFGQVSRMQELAYDVMHNNIEDPTDGALFYKAVNAKSEWFDTSPNLEYNMHIDGHVFYNGV